MKILHTADWHIGQLFHGYDRTYEHQQFLDWLVATLTERKIDVLLISGDIFDMANPSAVSIKMFYTFLRQSVQANPSLQVIITAGNHDSPSRLESPKPLLESSNIHIIGWVEKEAEGNIDFEKLTIPLKNREGITKAWCMAVPFLRIGDYPALPHSENPYTDGVAALYQEAYAHVLEKKEAGQAVIAMGHLHLQQAEITDMDQTERLIMGGVESIPASAFHEDIRYVALGHIHKAQRIGGRQHVRYCGSPLPMSFSELHYRHQVILLDLEETAIRNLEPLEVPVSIPLQRVPAVHRTLPEVLQAIGQLPEAAGRPEVAPYLEIRVLLDGPEPALRHKIETALQGKYGRLAKINVRYPQAVSPGTATPQVTPDQLRELRPLDIFSRVYQSKYQQPVPVALVQLFNQVVAQTEQQHENNSHSH